MPEGAFNTTFGPAAREGDVVRLLPRESLRVVEKLEQVPGLGPFDFGSVPANGTATTASGQTQQELTELELPTDQLGQFRFDIITGGIEIEVNQQGRQNQRFKTVNERGALTAETPEHLTEVYVLGDGVPYFIVQNPNPYEFDQSLVRVSGYRLVLSDPIDESDLGGRQPANVSIGQLEQRAQQRR